MAMEQPMRWARFRPLAAALVDVRIGVLASGLAAVMAVAASSSEASSPKKAHPPMFECTSAGALRVTCRGSFADGTSAAGIVVRVLDKTDHVVHVGLVDKLGRVSFRKPDAQFSVVFDAGDGNVLTLLGSEMT